MPKSRLTSIFSSLSLSLCLSSCIFFHYSGLTKCGEVELIRQCYIVTAYFNSVWEAQKWPEYCLLTVIFRLSKNIGEFSYVLGTNLLPYLLRRNEQVGRRSCERIRVKWNETRGLPLQSYNNWGIGVSLTVKWNVFQLAPNWNEWSVQGVGTVWTCMHNLSHPLM